MAQIQTGPEAIADGAWRLKNGGLVVFPTETVYGLGALALDPDAVGSVFAIKGRPATNPLIVHVSGEAMARTVVSDWPDSAQALAEAFWPGALTMVLPKDASVPSAVGAGGDTVAVRCPAHPMALALIESVGAPLVGPSANRSGRVSPTTADHAAEAFEDEDMLVIDGGACRAGIESTVVDLSQGAVRVLRPGIIGRGAIELALGGLGGVVDPGGEGSGADGSVRSPGVLGAHYQPGVPVRMVETHEIGDAGPGVFVLAWSVDVLEGSGGLAVLPQDAAGYARSMYAALHEGDASGCGSIWIERPDASDSDPIWEAVLERLGRACRTD